MEPRVNYALVGLFVLILGTALVVLVLWLVGVGPGGDYRTYAIYPPESMAGISTESPVKYQGVDVGKVREVALDPDDPYRVRVLIDVRLGVPIRIDTVASLASQGLTGLVYFIELRGGAPASPVLEAPPGASYPVIRSEPSEFVRLQVAGSELVEEARSAVSDFRATLAAVGALVGPDQRESIGAAIDAARLTTVALSGAAQTLKDDLDLVAPILEDLRVAVGRLPDLAERADIALDKGAQAAEAVRDAALELSTLTAKASPGLVTLTREGMPELVALLRDLRGLSARLDRLAAELEQDPNLLIYGRSRRAGPGER